MPRTDEPIQVVNSLTQMRVFTPADLGWSAVSVNTGASRLGTFVNVSGYRQVTLVINCTAKCNVYVFGRIAGVQINDEVRVNGTSAASMVITVAAVNRALVFPNGFEEIAVYIANTDTLSGTFSAAISAMP